MRQTAAHILNNVLNRGGKGSKNPGIYIILNKDLKGLDL